MTVLKEKAQTLTPLDELQTALQDDMAQVNALIIEHMQSDVALIPQLASYLIAAGGKRVRPLLTLATTHMLDGDMVRAHRLAAAVEFIHTATLLHDDVVDESNRRRGQQSANIVFGNEASVLVGDFLFSRAFQLMTADGSLEVLRILSSASAIIAEGEVKQLTTQNNLDTTLNDYQAVIEGKTASLFAAACEVGPVIAGKNQITQKAMRDYGMALGMAFQIIDDILDYEPARVKLGKNIGDDFKEGKMTAPVLFAREEDPPFWRRTLAERHQREDDFEYAQMLIEKAEALQKSRALAQDYGDQALSALAALPSSSLKTTLSDLIDFILSRSH